MHRLIRDNIYFYLPWLIWSIILMVCILIYDNQKFSLWINNRHTPAGDLFFKNFTLLGDGITVGIICFLLLFIQFRAALLAIVVSVVNMIITGFLKQQFGYPRPAKFFEGIDLNFVDGVDMYYHLSFPSGHTSAAFSIYLVLAILNSKKITGAFFFMVAFLVAVSRVYLLQHFVEDVLFGAFVGVSIATIISYYILKVPLNLGKGWDKSLRTVFSKSNSI